MKDELVQLAAVLRNRGRINSLHDINRAADHLDKLADSELVRQICLGRTTEHAGFSESSFPRKGDCSR